MTDNEPTPDPAPWWHSGAEGLPDIEALLGPDAMEAVGDVAEEALKLFVVLRDRFGAAPGEPGIQPEGGAAPAWSAMLGQLASGAVKAVNDVAAAAMDSQSPLRAGAGHAAGHQTDRQGVSGEAQPVLPGEAAACAYCPVCQAIAMFRTVPMSTWHRLAASIVEVADAARDLAGSPPGSTSGPVVVIAEPGGPYTSVEEFLSSVEVGAPHPQEPS